MRSYPKTLLEMARTAKNLFHRGLEIFKARDADGARDLQAADDKVDLLYSEAIKPHCQPSSGSGGDPEWRMRAALMVHYLERIGDHGVSIGGRTGVPRYRTTYRKRHAAVPQPGTSGTSSLFDALNLCISATIR